LGFTFALSKGRANVKSGEIMEHFLAIINKISDRVGKSASWLILPLIVAMVLSTILRYGFNRSPIWSYDMTWMLYAAHFLLGGAYCLLHEGHVRVDLFSERLAPRARSILEVVTYLIFFFPLCYVLVVYVMRYAYNSWISHEVSPSSSWAVPLGPIKTVMVIGFLLLTLEGISKFIKHLSAAAKREN